MTTDPASQTSTPERPASRRRFLRLGAAAAVAAAGGGYALGVGDWIVDRFSREPDGPLGPGTVEGSVIVVGAGPAGLTAAHLLTQRGAEVTVLEAAATHGGRIAHDVDFTDFPLSLGGEWIHVERSVLDDIVNDDSVDIETVTVGYRDDDEFGGWDEDDELYYETLPDYPDLKFVGSSWLDFFETYVVPQVSSLIRYNTVVESIAYNSAGVVVTDDAGGTHRADRVVMTAPVKILQLGLIDFEPPLPESHTRAIEEADVWSGFKAFIEFDDAFYPPLLAPPDSENRDGQRLYYDAAYGQDTDANILGLYSVGAQAERYQDAGDHVIDLILDELDAVFDGAVSPSYRRHVTQNWNEQPFARAAFLSSHADYRLTRRLAEPVAGRVFFAGDAYTRFDDWGSVHSAVYSARDAVRSMLTDG